MARSGTSVTWTEKEIGRLPDWAAEGTALVLDLERRGVLAELSGRLRIRRQGGYAGIDVMLALLYFFSSNLHVGVRDFWSRAVHHAESLGAVGGRLRLPSPAALSRALESVEVERIRPLATWLLVDVAGASDVLRHPSVLLYDARGEGLHVFDFDPTVTVLRHRALPEGPDLPEPRRRSQDLAAPGYSGRKRGDVQFRRATLQHAGSGLWLQARLAEGNGDGRAELAAAVDTVREVCGRIDHPLDRTLMRTDGEFGWVPYFALWRERGVPFLTRLTRPELFDRSDIQRRLAEATWTLVPDDGSGPRRAAAELGMVTVTPGGDTLREDGTAYAPVTVRVVVSRYPRTGEAKHGRVIEGWQYELFAVDLPPDSLPAAEAVHTFFARAGQENRFAQEDREIGLDRIISYHLPGQELAALVGLLVWNLRIARGFELERPPEVAPALLPYVSERDGRPSPDAPTVAEPEPEMSPPRDIATAEARLVEALGTAPWARWSEKNPGWTWRVDLGKLQCPKGKLLSLTHVRAMPQKDRLQLGFRSEQRACVGCTSRVDCLRNSEAVTKCLGVSVDRAVGKGVERSLKALRRLRKGVSPKAAWRTVRRMRVADTDVATLPRHAVEAPRFLPAEARKLFRRGTQELSIRVLLDLPPPPRPQPRLLIDGPARRQHRRLTWAQHLARYALPDGAKVSVHVDGRSAIRALLDPLLAKAVG